MALWGRYCLLERDPGARPCPRAPVWGASRSLSPQVGVVSAFAQTLRRYTSLNHLAQAARAVLQNTSQINQMLSDLNRVDFANVQVSSGPQVSWGGAGGASWPRARWWMGTIAQHSTGCHLTLLGRWRIPAPRL